MPDQLRRWFKVAAAAALSKLPPVRCVSVPITRPMSFLVVARFSDRFVDERHERFAFNLLRKITFQNGNLLSERIGALLVVACLDRAIERFLRLLDNAFEHRIHIGFRDVAAFVHFDRLQFRVNLTQNVASIIVVRLHG